MPDKQDFCPERVQLAAKVKEAVKAMYAAAKARAGGEENGLAQLTAARANERAAVKALESHREEHGC